MFGLPVLKWVDRHPGTVLLESGLAGSGNKAGFLFANPVKIIRADALEDVMPALHEVESVVNKGAYVAGFLAYEAGYAFERALPSVRHPEVPLVWFGVYETPVVLDHQRRKLSGGTARVKLSPGSQNGLRSKLDRRIPVPGFSGEQHAAAVERIQQYITAGDTYQVNLTFPLSFALSDNDAPSAWYEALRRSQRVPYSAFINTQEFAVLSVSPELFFRKEGSRLTLKPMKGTAPRGRNLAEDVERRTWLQESEKDRAENLMIVDLLRNDAGHLAVPGSVKVRSFFDIERYETVFQATTTIQASLRKGVRIPELVRALFPSGSVTGAPKIRTMQLIHELEPVPRGVYTGAIGFFSPNGKAVFSVAIRTATLNKRTGQAVVGVGSGVVHDSDVHGEYEECLLKAKFLTETSEEFRLIETILLRPDRGWFLLPLHLKRLRESAQYFGFRYPRDTITMKLKEASSRKISAGSPLRVRILLSRDGSIEFQKTTLEPAGDEAVAGMAKSRTDSRDRFLYHKTTRRDLYEREFDSPAARGRFDLIFQNEKGEVTEGTRSNIVIRVGDKHFTPPVDSGLLPGTFRSHLFRSKKIPIMEKTLYPDDLASADEIFLCNAVRGMVKVRIPELSP